MKRSLSLFMAMVLFASTWIGCTSEQKELLDLEIDPPDRKSIDRSIVGVNNFFNQNEFGSIPQQFSEIKSTLGLHYVRVLFAWDTSVQPTPNSEASFGLFDEIVNNIPAGVDVVVVLAHTPSWMANPTNWIDGDPRKTWIENWLKPVVTRYAGRSGIVGWEIWNEPDLLTVPSDDVLELEDPDKYFALLQLGSAAIRRLDPSRLILNAATSSIQQRYPNPLSFNQRLQELGAASLVDVWNVHFYGEQYENVVRDNGVQDFLNSLGKPIWITESGETGTNEQLAYAETVWPFLTEKVPSIDRIYWYQFASSAPVGESFGLKSSDPNFPVSDLYVHLRDAR